MLQTTKMLLNINIKNNRSLIKSNLLPVFYCTYTECITDLLCNDDKTIMMMKNRKNKTHDSGNEDYL